MVFLRSTRGFRARLTRCRSPCLAVPQEKSLSAVDQYNGCEEPAIGAKPSSRAKARLVGTASMSAVRSVHASRKSPVHSKRYEAVLNVARPKLNKYPGGYPGDTEETFPLAERSFKSIRTRFRYQCHSCSTIFKEHEKICASCQHELCPECPRHPPKKIRTQPVEALMERVAQKLAVVDITSQASAV